MPIDQTGSTPIPRTGSRHRASEPVANPARSASAGTHRGGRSAAVPVAALLGVVVLVAAAVLAVHH